MQLQALFLISAQETCNQAKVNSKSHYQWKRMISCAHPMRCDQLAIGEWFNASLELWENSFLSQPWMFFFLSNFLPKIAWNIPSRKLTYPQKWHFEDDFPIC